MTQKKSIKSKSTKYISSPGFRTSDIFRKKIFSGKASSQAKFNPSQFKTQHKGG